MMGKPTKSTGVREFGAIEVVNVNINIGKKTNTLDKIVIEFVSSISHFFLKRKTATAIRTANSA